MTKKASRTKARYATHPGYAMQDAIISNLKQKTRKSLGEWIRVVKESGPSAKKERAQWLKAKHRLGGTTAAVIRTALKGRRRNTTRRRLSKQCSPGREPGCAPFMSNY